jgi:hypothetical protein
VFFAGVGEQPSDAVGPVPHAGPPDRGLIAFELISDNLCPFAVSARQDDPRALHLEPGERLAPGNLTKVRFVIGTQNQSVWFSATHGRKAPDDLDSYCHLNARANFVQTFCPETLGL